jgi:phosphatidate cytidylyltransferase
MLKQRVFTALVLLLVFLPTLFSTAVWPFQVLSALLVTAAAWEWAKLNGCGRAAAIAWAAWFVCWVIALGFSTLPPALWLVAGFAWLLLGPLLLRAGVLAWPGYPRWLRLLLGQLALVSAWLALVQARTWGGYFLLSILVLVWVADSAAYFAGRAWGGRIFSRKLAALISPGKSWEGVLGAFVGVVALAFLWRWLDVQWPAPSPSWFTHMAQSGWLWMVLAALLLASMGVVGDLLQSLVKRSAGVKDSSTLLPGHGGVLDRIDALLPVLPLAMMLVSWP